MGRGGLFCLKLLLMHLFLIQCCLLSLGGEGQGEGESRLQPNLAD